MVKQGKAEDRTGKTEDIAKQGKAEGKAGRIAQARAGRAGKAAGGPAVHTSGRHEHSGPPNDLSLTFIALSGRVPRLAASQGLCRPSHHADLSGFQPGS